MVDIKTFKNKIITMQPASKVKLKIWPYSDQTPKNNLDSIHSGAVNFSFRVMDDILEFYASQSDKNLCRATAQNQIKYLKDRETQLQTQVQLIS